MREIVLDTETTGLDPNDGHRVVEIGCLELFNHVATGRTYHCYLNPERDMPTAAFEVHGLGDEFLAQQKKFSEIAEAFLAFIGDAPLVAHNARFDMGFINAELRRDGRPLLPMERAVDTVAIARKKFPGAPASLDALCRRFDIDLSARTLHGALLDAELLAEVYLELRGGRQPGLGLAAAEIAAADRGMADRAPEPVATVVVRPPRPHGPTEDELAAHRAFVASLENALWLEPETERAG